MSAGVPATAIKEPRRCAPPAVRAALAAYRAALEKAFPQRVSRVTLFGSMARGEAHEESDVDVLVVVETLGPGERAHAIDLGGELGLATALVIAPLVLTRAEWDELVRRERLLVTEIERDGIEA